MKFRLVILNEHRQHITDKIIDTEDFKVSGGIVVIKPNQPFLCGGIIIEPDPEQPKPTFSSLTKSQKADILRGKYQNKA